MNEIYENKGDDKQEESSPDIAKLLAGAQLLLATEEIKNLRDFHLQEAVRLSLFDLNGGAIATCIAKKPTR